MNVHKPSRVFTTLSCAKLSENPKDTEVNKPVMEQHAVTATPHMDHQNHIQVTAIGEVSEPPDRCRVYVSVKSNKEQVQDVKNSVARRLDYVIQTLHNHQIKENDIHITKVLRHDGSSYLYQADVTVYFVDFNKCQSVCNLFVEKLDHESVNVSLPEFYHSPSKQESLRHQASLAAAQNAKAKANELATFLNGQVGGLLSLCEESCNEWEGCAGSTAELTLAKIQRRLKQATLNISVKVTASFQLKTKEKSKKF